MKKLLILLTLVSVLSACRKYVEIKQEGSRTFIYTSDYRYLLNNNSIFESAFGLPVLSGDDIDITDASRQNNLNTTWIPVYTWTAPFFSDALSDADWDRMFAAIYNANVVIDGVMNSEKGTETEKKKLFGEALVHRAFNYLSLVNLYAKQYEATTAKTDPGLPLLLNSYLFNSLKRASVEDVYTQIVIDLKTAIPALPALPDYNVRPAKVSAYALLSRAYLNKRDFTQAGLYADSALRLQSTLIDLKNFATSTSNFPKRLNDPEILLSKTLNGLTYTALPLSQSLLDLLGTKDLRYILFTKPGSNFSGQFSAAFTGRAYWRYQLNGESNIILTGPSVPEMMLNKAECLARAGQTNEAMTIVNDLRKKRFTDADFTLLTATTAEEALKIVVDERKREFFGRGLRWFDQKRLNLDPQFAETKTRIFKGTTYTLEPNSKKYVYPIGEKYRLLNPELEQNPF